MGTSKSYSASIKAQPQWGNLSGSVTSNCNGSRVSADNLDGILSKYVGVIGGASAAGRGNSKIGGRAGIRTALKLGAFLGGLAVTGTTLRAELSKVGITDLEGKPAGDVINQLLEYCSGPSSTLDDVAAKTAAQKILEELAGASLSLEDFEENLKQALTAKSLEDILIRYFGYYIFEHLSIMFYEKLVSEKGKTNCESLFGQIRDYIIERLVTVNKTNPLNSIDWSGSEADRLIKNIQEDVLNVFENHDG